jgi:hypothetical protein
MPDVDDALVDRDPRAERDWRRPQMSSSWLALSTRLCTPSVSIADEPVIAAATNLETAMPRFAASAMIRVRLLSVAALMGPARIAGTPARPERRRRCSGVLS